MSAPNSSQILDTIRELLSEANQDRAVAKVDVAAIDKTTNLRRLRLDSLDMISFRFSLDQAFNINIPDEDFEAKQLTIVGNLIRYIQDKLKS